MTKREQRKIRTAAFVRVGGELVNVDELTQEQRVRLGTLIRCTLINELFRGQAVATCGEESKASLASL